jgi:hypothetical protein
MILSSSDIFDVRLPIIAEGMVDVRCFCKHFVDGNLALHREVALRSGNRELTGEASFGELKEAGGVVQLLWRINIQISLTPVGTTQGNGNLIYDFEYSAGDGAPGRMAFDGVRRRSPFPRTRGIHTVTVTEDNPPVRSSGNNHSSRSAFEMTFAASGSGPGLSLGPISLGNDNTAASTSVRCSTSLRFSNPGAKR